MVDIGILDPRMFISPALYTKFVDQVWAELFMAIGHEQHIKVSIIDWATEPSLPVDLV